VKLLQHWLTRQAERRPDAAAISWKEETVSFAELEELSNRLARMLIAQGCSRGDRVALLLPKGPLAIGAMLAVLKADCSYTPLDTRNPAVRIARVLGALDCRCVLAAGSTAALLRDALDQLPGSRAGAPLVGLLETGVPPAPCGARFTLDDVAFCSPSQPDQRNTSDDSAHILFTSGSTGVPKGVVITHANVIHFVEWAVGRFGLGSTDRVSGHSPLHFDLSTFDVFGALAAGATLYPIPPEANLLPHKLAELIERAELTQWFSVPSILQHMAKQDVVRQGAFPSLRRLLWCGERFPTSGLMYWMRRLPHVEFTNLYGPTETTIASSHYTLSRAPGDEREEIPIGKGCDGEELLVLDQDLRPAAVGETGQLYIRGPGLSPGYWRDPERTAAAFIPDPFGSKPDSSPKARLYRTGDLAQLTEGGNIVLLGRADTQVKSRGYRIELGEIEAALDGIAELQESAVVAIGSDGFDGNVLCCAYVPRAGGQIAPAALRQRLAGVLPAYMLPARWLRLDRLPLNGNGKTDRPALKALWQND
jgi:amino acid adenylation domain-containing protein